MCLSDKQGYPWSQGSVACSTQRGSHAVTQTHMLLFAEDKSWQFSRKKDSYAVKEIPEGSHHLFKKNWILWEREKSQTERPWWKGSAGFHNKISVLSFLLAGYYKLCKPGRLPKKIVQSVVFHQTPLGWYLCLYSCWHLYLYLCWHLSTSESFKTLQRSNPTSICWYLHVCFYLYLCWHLYLYSCWHLYLYLCWHLSTSEWLKTLQMPNLTDLCPNPNPHTFKEL